MLRLKSNCERVIKLVLSHGRKGDVLWIWEIFQRGAVDVSKKLSNLSDTVRPVVEEEYLITIYSG